MDGKVEVLFREDYRRVMKIPPSVNQLLATFQNNENDLKDHNLDLA